MKPSFVCSYQGASDYSYEGHRYLVRSSADDWRPGIWKHTEEEYQQQRIAAVGTIMNYSGRITEFPPQEIEEFFPGYVRARLDVTTGLIEYAGPRPDVVHNKRVGATLAAAWAQEHESRGTTV